METEVIYFRFEMIFDLGVCLHCMPLLCVWLPVIMRASTHNNILHLALAAAVPAARGAMTRERPKPWRLGTKAVNLSNSSQIF